MRYLVLMSAVGLSLAIAACGGSGGGASGDKSAAAVRSTMRAYLEDLKNNRPGDACDLMTDGARTAAGGGSPTACAAHTRLALAFLGQKRIANLEAKLGQLPIRIIGDHATAPPLTGSGAGASFIYSGGRWLIDRNS
jgi:hypothetical protein